MKELVPKELQLTPYQILDTFYKMLCILKEQNEINAFLFTELAHGRMDTMTDKKSWSFKAIRQAIEEIEGKLNYTYDNLQRLKTERFKPKKGQDYTIKDA